MKTYMNAQEFNLVYERYRDLLYRIGYTYLKNEHDVADLLQEVFVKRLYHAPSFQSEEHEKRWMIRVTVNLAKNQRKSFWSKNVTKMAEMLESPECNNWQMSERQKDLLAAVVSLPEKQRIALYLHYFEGYTCKEIADILHCTESAIKMRLKKGRMMLRDDLSQEDYHEYK